VGRGAGADARALLGLVPFVVPGEVVSSVWPVKACYRRSAARYGIVQDQFDCIFISTLLW